VSNKSTRGYRITHTHTDESRQHSFLKLESLTLLHLDIVSGLEQQLPDLLKERRDRNLGLKKLVVQSCRVHEVGDKSRCRESVKEVEWTDVIPADQDSDDEVVVANGRTANICIPRFDPYDADVCVKYHNYIAE